GRVDVHQDIAVGVDRLQGDELGHHVVCRRVVYLHPEEDDPLLEELVVRVHLLDPVRRPLDERRQDVPGFRGLPQSRRPAPRATCVAHCHFLCSPPPGHETAPTVGTSVALRITRSTNPESFASSALNHRSLSESISICSRVWPACIAIRSASVRFTYSTCSAWLLMSVPVPPIP